MEPNTNARTKEIVMRRVRTAHAVRPFVSGGALALLALLVSFYGITREVWVARVFANMPRMADIAGVARFFAEAFLNTRSVVQILSVLALVAVVWLARETARLIASPVHRFA